MKETKNSSYKYLFGPVPSRRFGRSLGVDLTTFKTCSMDCIFCQIGRTTNKTVERKEYVPVNTVLAELKEWIDAGGEADYITLSGSGEPTLHTHFGDVINLIKQRSDIPAVLLTNGTMLSLPEVREGASAADVVKVSLSACDQQALNYINRPHPQVDFVRLIDGIKSFRDVFKGELWLEVFLVWGVNSTPGDISKISALACELKPDRIQLNTSVRPPAEDFVTALPDDFMIALADLFNPVAEVIAEFSSDHAAGAAANEETILAMLKRRPCTTGQTAEVFGMHPNEAAKYLGKLTRTGQIHAERRNASVYYIAGRT